MPNNGFQSGLGSLAAEAGASLIPLQLITVKFNYRYIHPLHLKLFRSSVKIVKPYPLIALITDTIGIEDKKADEYLKRPSSPRLVK